MSIKKLVAIVFLPVILIVIIPILWAAFDPVIHTPVFMGVATFMIYLVILSASLAISYRIREEKRITAFVVAFFGSELSFLLFSVLQVFFTGFLYVLTPVVIAFFAVFFSPISLILSLSVIGVIDVDSGSSSDHKSYDRYNEGIHLEPGEMYGEYAERLERYRRIEELRKWEDERYQDP
jgi:hypothetical protein